MSQVFQEELRFLGITSSPAFVREPEGNGCAERFIRTLKEHLLWLKMFDTVEKLRLALHELQRKRSPGGHGVGVCLWTAYRRGVFAVDSVAGAL